MTELTEAYIEYQKALLDFAPEKREVIMQHIGEAVVMASEEADV